MLERPRLRAHFRLDVAAPDLVVLRSEDGPVVLEGRILPLIAPYLDGQHSLSDIAEALAGRATILDIRYGLSQLEDEHCLIDGTDPDADDDLEPFRQWAEVLGADTTDLDRWREGGVEVRSVGAISPWPLINRLIELGVECAPGGERLVVVTDDYTRVETMLIPHPKAPTDRPWMMVRPVGLHVAVGPIFQHGGPAGSGGEVVPAGPCAECLLRSLLPNDPYPLRLVDFDAILEDPEAAELGVPRVSPKPLADLAWDLATAQVLRWLAVGRVPELEGAFVTLDTRTLERSTHRFPRQYGCRVCDPDNAWTDADRARLPEPIELRSVQRLAGSDGGYRTVPVDEVLGRLEPWISPLTGTVTAVERQRTDRSGLVQVYYAQHLFPSADDREELLFGGRRKSAGKGRAAAQAKASALCEALERASGVLQAHDPRITARLEDLDTAIHPHGLLGFSEQQYLERERWNAEGLRFTWIPEPFDPSEAIDWTPVWSMTGQCVRHVPTAYAYFHTPQVAGHRFCRGDSNGGAAGSCLEEAMLQGLLELVERDAVALWWANRLRRPAVDLGTVDLGTGRSSFFQASVRRYGELGRVLHVLDLTHDLGIPVAAALSWGADDRSDILLGFGAHLDAGVAVSRAITEMNQFLPGLLAGEERQILSRAPEPEAWEYLEPFGPARVLGDPVGPGSDDLKVIVEWLIARLEARGLDVLALDQTRPEIGLSVVKMIVPGLRHYWPRWAPGRLYDVPVDLGWLPARLPESALNPVHLLI